MRQAATLSTLEAERWLAELKTEPVAIIREVNVDIATASFNKFFRRVSGETVDAFPELNTEAAATNSRDITVAKERRKCGSRGRAGRV